jgi:pimeloyl-ACP methyl ester carboxylesterase
VQSLFWDSRKSHAIVQADDVQGNSSIVRFRVLRKITDNVPEVGTPVSLSGWLGSTPEHFGYAHRYHNVTLPNGTTGWLFPNNGDKWVIHVHGRRAMMGETLRNLEQFQNLGFNQLTISMSTDPKPYGRGVKVSKLGQTEWTEIEDAVRFATAAGARDIMLFGWSQGSLISSQFLINSSATDLVRGAIFDSPLLDYRTTMRFQAQRGGYDTVLGDRVIDAIRDSKAIRLVGYSNVDVDEISLVKEKKLPAIPVLVLYSMNDGHVAIADVHKFAEINPGVSLYEIPNARHCRLYNEDKNAYQAAISAWLLENRI